MRYPTLRKTLWRLSQFFAVACLFLPPFMAFGSLIFPACICNPYTVFICSDKGKALNMALANVARILGTGAALTLLATAADREIGKITARDVLREQYPGLMASYGSFFILVFFASFTGDCNQSIVAAFSTVGATVLSIWFFGLSLILLLDTRGQRNMAFSYYVDTIAKPKTAQNERVFLLKETVNLTKDAPLCWDSLCRIFQVVISLFSDGDEASKISAMYDRWAEVKVLTGVKMIEAAWSTLWQTSDPKDGFSRLQADMICRNILIDPSWKKTPSGRAILLIGLASFWLPWEKGCTYVDAYAELKNFCEAQRAENKGDPWSEQIISELVCVFGMAMAVSLVNQDKPSWVDEKDLDAAWKQFAGLYQSSVFSAIDNSDKDYQVELANLLECVEWLSRKRLGISWAEYRSDRRNLVAGKNPGAGAVAAVKLTNIRLLDILISKYIRRYTGG